MIQSQSAAWLSFSSRDLFSEMARFFYFAVLIALMRVSEAAKGAVSLDVLTFDKVGATHFCFPT